MLLIWMCVMQKKQQQDIWHILKLLKAPCRILNMLIVLLRFILHYIALHAQ